MERGIGRRVAAGIVAIGLGLLAARAFGSRSFIGDGLLLTVAGGLILGWALSVEPKRPSLRIPFAWPSRGTLAVGLLAIALAVATIFSLQGTRLPPVGVLTYVVSIGLVFGFVISLDRHRGLAWRASVPRWEILALAGIVAVSAAIRLVQLGSVPFGIWYDESNTALKVQELIAEPGLHVFITDTFRPLNVYSYALSMAIFGPTVWAIRLPEAIAGALTVPAMYLAGRRLFGPQVGIVAAALIGFSRWDLTFSRIGFDGIWVPLLVLLAVYFATRGLERGSAIDLALAGFTVGFGLYSYIPFRIFPVVLGIYLVLKAVSERRSGGGQLAGIGLLIAAAFVIGAPFLWFAATHPAEVMARSDSASLFTNLPPDQAQAALVENVRKHLLMFNVQGDPNGRHNIPGEPMLDPITGGLFAIGSVVALMRFFKPSYAFLLLNLAIMMLGGILSVAFEAPQSLRSIGALPSAMLLAAIPLGRVWELASPLAGQGGLRLPSKYPVVIWLRRVPHVLVVLVLLAGARLAVGDYFTRQANAFASWAVHSTAETIVAHRLQELRGVDADIYVSNLYVNHPTIEWLVPDAPDYQTWDIATGLPLRTDRSEVWIFLDPEQRATVDQIRAYYPTGLVEPATAPGSTEPAALYEVQLTREDLAAVEGLEVRYFSGSELGGQPAARERIGEFDVDWQQAPPELAAPFTGEIAGTLFVPEYGQYTFSVDGLPGILEIDGRAVLAADQPSATLVLAKGNHVIRWTGTIAELNARTTLRWQRPNAGLEVVSAKYLYVPPVVTSGLLGRYFGTPDWSGSPTFERIDPALATYYHITPLPRPYSVQWVGKLYAPRTGQYQLGVEQISESQLFVDGELLVDNREHNQRKLAPINLTEGYHDLEVRFIDRDGYSHIYLYWLTPGGPLETIPSAYLMPPQGSYPDKPLALTVGPATRPTPGLGGGPAQPMPTSVELPPVTHLEPDLVVGDSSQDLFTDPRSLAVAPDGTFYVLDSETGQVKKFDAAGELLTYWGGRGDGDGEFQDPSAIGLTSQGDLLVLDARPNWIHRFDANGRFLEKLGGPAAGFYNPRGFHIDSANMIYVADTGGTRVVILAPDGRVVKSIGTKGDGPGQMVDPTDVLKLPSGDILVVDSGNNRLQLMDPSGRFIGALPIGPSTSVHGPHLTLAPDGSFYLTDPERNQVIHFDVNFTPITVFGGKGGEPGQFNRPVGVATGSDGSVFVADTLNRRVQRFRP